MSTEAYCSRYG